MTKIRFIYNGNLIKGFAMNGHAEFDSSGKDILCSALSATSQMTINGIADWIGIDMDDDVLRQDQPSGKLIMILPEGYYEHVVVQQLFKSFEMYMEELETLYPQNISIRKKVH